MHTVRQVLVLPLLLLCSISTVHARKQVLSTVIYTNYGERTPIDPDHSPSLTPLGATQLFRAGSLVREQYIAKTGNVTTFDDAIWNISVDQIDNEQLTVLTSPDQWIVASAQAFMQGLYPPVQNSSFSLANGTEVQDPTNGHQFAKIVTAPTSDASSIWAAGTRGCSAYSEMLRTYLRTEQYQQLQNDSQPFYDNLYTKYLTDNFKSRDVGYWNAIIISDFLQYAHTHNKTLLSKISTVDLEQARTYAELYATMAYSNLDPANTRQAEYLQAIAGRTLAKRILSSFADHVDMNGRYNKINLLFGDIRPMMSFAALAGLQKSEHSPYYAIPAPGSSFIFELFTIRTNNDSLDTYPLLSELRVRFRYTNGTDQYSSTVDDYLFGNSPSSGLYFTLEDFARGLENFMIQNVTDWCSVCQSKSTFCQALSSDDPGQVSKITQHHSLSPVVSGIVGAIVTLIVAALIFAAVLFLGGFRMQRISRKRSSELGGFKGAEKLASDLDVSVPKGGAGAVVVETGVEEPRGHERVGSWELREQLQHKDTGVQNAGLDTKGMHARRPSYEDDEIHVNPFSTPVRPRDSL